jgi:predicted TIM-barrel fold metal-dependent hydrolase
MSKTSMANATVIDALFSLPAKGLVAQISDCVPFAEDLAPKMLASGIAGAVLAHGNCAVCQHQWNCADRRTHEVMNVVGRNPRQMRGLAAYDPLQIGESLRWIDDAASAGLLGGAYVQAECCASGLAAPRMYPLYGSCAKLRVPIVMDFEDRARWVFQRPQVELVAADFPELDILLATPPQADAGSILLMMQRFPRVSFLLSPQQLHCDTELCEYVELQGRERALFCSANLGWSSAIEIADGLALSPGARRAYFSENAVRLFSFPVGAASNFA